MQREEQEKDRGRRMWLIAACGNGAPIQQLYRATMRFYDARNVPEIERYSFASCTNDHEEDQDRLSATPLRSFVNRSCSPFFRVNRGRKRVRTIITCCQETSTFSWLCKRFFSDLRSDLSGRIRMKFQTAAFIPRS